MPSCWSRFSAKPQRCESFSDLLAQARSDLDGTEGCRGARVFQDIDEPMTFTLLERWESKVLCAR